MAVGGGGKSVSVWSGWGSGAEVHSSSPQQRLDKLGNVQQSRLERRCRARRAVPRNHVPLPLFPQQDWFYPNWFRQIVTRAGNNLSEETICLLNGIFYISLEKR